MSSVLVIGDINVDVVTQYAGELNHNSDTPSHTSITLGGSPSNVSTWLAHRDVSVDLLGGVGEDLFGSWAREQLTGYGVGTSLVSVFESSKTGTCVILVNEAGERTMLPDPGANLQVNPDAAFDAAIDAADALVMSAYSVIRPQTRDMAVHAVRRARTRGMNVVLDAASAAPIRDAGPSLVRQWLQQADIVVANEDEVDALGSDTSDDWMTQFPNLIVKRGARGATWYVDGVATHDVAAADINVIDTTGAGDAFLAGIVASLSQDLSWQSLDVKQRIDALDSATLLAGECCARIGATPGARA